jgi:hypothetical protein
VASAETARLIASLELQDKFTPGIAKADRALTGFERRTTSSFSKLGTGLGRAGSNLKSFVSSGAGLLGVGLGIGGVAAGLTAAITKTEEFAKATQNFAAITGLSAENASKWVDVLDKFGISGDTAVKTYSRLLVNAEKYGGTVKGATKFQKEFGVNLVDNKGHLVDANELLKRSADFFNSNATAAEKATTLTKLYGKGWQTLIPLLLKGRKGIEAEFGSALTLTKEQLRQMAELLAVQKDWNDALGDAAVKVGVALIPTLTKALRGLTTFVDQNSDKIAEFAKGLVKGAEELGGAIAGLAPVAKGIADAWNSIPADFRKLLLGGLVANKVLKMTIGFDPIDIARTAVTDSIGKIVGGFFGRGSPANPMFTKEVGLPGAPTVPGAPPGGPGGITVPAIGAGIAIELAPIIGPGSPVDELRKEVRSWKQGKNTTLPMFPGGIGSVGFTGFEGRGPGFRPGPLGAAGAGAAQTIAKGLDRLHQDFLLNNTILKESKDPAAIAAAATAAADEVVKGVGSVGTTKEIIATLKEQIAATKDPALRRVLMAALARVERKLPGREWIAEQKAAANKIVRSNESVGQKVKDLRAIQAQLIAHGDTAAARIVGALINGVIPAINNIRIVGGTTLPAILPQGPGPRRKNNAPTPTTPRTPREGQNRGNPVLANVRLNVVTGWNSNTKAQVVHSRMGPSPAEAGAT